MLSWCRPKTLFSLYFHAIYFIILYPINENQPQNWINIFSNNIEILLGNVTTFAYHLLKPLNSVAVLIWNWLLEIDDNLMNTENYQSLPFDGTQIQERFLKALLGPSSPFLISISPEMTRTNIRPIWASDKLSRSSRHHFSNETAPAWIYHASQEYAKRAGGIRTHSEIFPERRRNTWTHTTSKMELNRVSKVKTNAAKLNCWLYRFCYGQFWKDNESWKYGENWEYTVTYFRIWRMSWIMENKFVYQIPFMHLFGIYTIMSTWRYEYFHFVVQWKLNTLTFT